MTTKKKAKQRFMPILEALRKIETDADGWFINLYRSIGQAGIADTSGSTLKIALDWLVYEGYVDVERFQSHRRRYRLTEKGRQDGTLQVIPSVESLDETKDQKRVSSEDETLMAKVGERLQAIGGRLAGLDQERQDLEKERESLREAYLQLEAAEKAREKARQLLAE